VTGAAFDYKRASRPSGDLFILTGENSGPVSNKVLRITLPSFLVVPLFPNTFFITAELYADAGQFSVGLAITDEELTAQRLFTWRIGDNKAFPDDDLMQLVRKLPSGAVFPAPRQINLNNGISTSNQCICFDVIRDEMDDQILHVIYFERDISKHSYFRYNLRTTESEWVSTNVILDERNDRCYLGSMNPNVDGEFWCIRKQIGQSSEQELIRINLKGSPDPIEVGVSRTLPISVIAAIAFAYDTTQAPSMTPSKMPSRKPSQTPSRKPSKRPSSRPSRFPSEKPSRKPSRQPSEKPSVIPSENPSAKPSRKPSRRPSRNPTELPTGLASAIPSEKPSRKPSRQPSSKPSRKPSGRPSRRPSTRPSKKPSARPSVSRAPSQIPSETPSRKPSKQPTV
jgi:hypothetical protein